VRRIAAQLGIPGIISKVSGCDQGRVDIEPLPRKESTRRNQMVHKALGRQPKTPESVDTAQVQCCQGRVDSSAFSAPKRMCARSSPPLEPLLASFNRARTTDRGRGLGLRRQPDALGRLV
jgi:hypothetical protein